MLEVIRGDAESVDELGSGIVGHKVIGEGARNQEDAITSTSRRVRVPARWLMIRRPASAAGMEGNSSRYATPLGVGAMANGGVIIGVSCRNQGASGFSLDVVPTTRMRPRAPLKALVGSTKGGGMYFFQGPAGGPRRTKRAESASEPVDSPRAKNDAGNDQSGPRRVFGVEWDGLLERKGDPGAGGGFGERDRFAGSFGAEGVVGSCVRWHTYQQMGTKKTLLTIGVLYALSAIGSALSNDPAFLHFQAEVGGLGVGASTIAAPAYISEIAPAKDRGRLVSLYQFNIVLGILVAFFSNYLLSGIGDNDWRWMLDVGSTIPAIIYTLFVITIPESPRWLISQLGVEEAKKGNEDYKPGSGFRIAGHTNGGRLCRRTKGKYFYEKISLSFNAGVSCSVL